MHVCDGMHAALAVEQALAGSMRQSIPDIGEAYVAFL